MLFNETRLSGTYLIKPTRNEDDRGYFARTWCAREFGSHGLTVSFVQSSISFNPRVGTMRGMHFQDQPFPETKLVRCSKGAIFDVVVDLRSDSATFCHWIGYDLTAENQWMLYVPAGCGHGFLTREKDSEVTYLISEHFRPELSRGVRWNDPAFGIEWPGEPLVISSRDANYPDFLPPTD